MNVRIEWYITIQQYEITKNQSKTNENLCGSHKISLVFQNGLQRNTQPHKQQHHDKNDNRHARQRHKLISFCCCDYPSTMRFDRLALQASALLALSHTPFQSK